LEKDIKKKKKKKKKVIRRWGKRGTWRR